MASRKKKGIILQQNTHLKLKTGKTKMSQQQNKRH